MEVELALEVVGGFRRWHLCLFAFISVSQYVAIAFHGFSSLFIGFEPEHRCNSNMKLHGILNEYNLNISDLLYRKFEHENSSFDFMKCHEYSVCMTNSSNNSVISSLEIVPCKFGWIYQNYGYYSIVEEWNLVCDRNFLVELSQCLFIIGCLFGDLCLSFLIDKYGRKRIHVVSHGIICILGITTSFSVSYLMFALCRTFIGMFCAVNLISGAMCGFELFSSKQRTIPGICMQLGFIFCYFTLSALAYFIQQWRYLQLTVSLTCGLFALIGCILPESVPWLFYRGKIKEAEEILRKMARHNGVTLEPGKKLLTSSNIYVKSVDDPIVPPNAESNEEPKKVIEFVIVKSSHSQQESVPNAKLKDALNDKIMVKFIIVLGIIWFTTSTGLHSIMLSSSNLGGNRFINFLALASLDVPGVLLTTLLCNKLGRRPTLFCGILCGGIFSVTVSLLPPEINGVNLFWASIVFLVLAKTCFASAFIVLQLYTKELFPTNLRSSCTGICQVWGRFGNLLAPLSSYLLKTKFYWIPYIVIGCLDICVGLFVLLLPETMGKASPETLEDCHHLDESTKCFKNC